MSDRSNPGLRGRFLAASAVVLFAAAVPAAAMILIAEPGGPDQDLYNEGRAFVFEENWGKARDVFETLAKRYPGSAFLDDALYWTAFSLYEESRPEQGYQTLRTLVTRFPDSPWNDDARALMVRCAEAALKTGAAAGGTRIARAGDGDEYRRFLEESTRDRSAQVSLLAINTLLNQEPEKAADLLGRVAASPSRQEGAVVVLDRFFGRERVKVTFDDPTAGFAEGNAHVLVRDGDQAVRFSLVEALDAVQERGERRVSEAIRREMRDRILEAERSLVTTGPARPAPAAPSATSGRGRTATIVRVVDGEAHYYTNGAETIRILVLRRAAGFTPDNIQIFVEGTNGTRHLQLSAVSGPTPAAEGLSRDATEYIRQTLGVIQLDLTNPSR